MALDLQPLTCPQCAAPVPLADAESLTCPYCQAQVPVPDAYRELRRERTELSGEKAAASALYERIGRVPPSWLKRFEMFETPWFWLGGAAFFLTAACFVAVVIVQLVNFGLELSGHEDIAQRASDAFVPGFAIEALWVGLLIAGWNHKRLVSRAGLQAALAASPPGEKGGPARCRRCAAPLSIPQGALGVRCDYCGADNLVAIPKGWLDATQQVEKALVNEERSALQAEEEANRALRWSLFWRLVVCLIFLSVPIGIYFGGDT